MVRVAPAEPGWAGPEHVSRETSRARISPRVKSIEQPGDVSRETSAIPRGLFPNAEGGEDPVQEVFGIDRPGDAAKRAGGQSQILRHKFGPDANPRGL